MSNIRKNNSTDLIQVIFFDNVIGVYSSLSLQAQTVDYKDRVIFWV